MCFVRLATEARRNFVLLTDGYFKTDLRDHEWKVELYNGSEKVDVADLADVGVVTLGFLVDAGPGVLHVIGLEDVLLLLDALGVDLEGLHLGVGDVVRRCGRRRPQ